MHEHMQVLDCTVQSKRWVTNMRQHAGLFQTIAGLKIRDVYEKVTQKATAKAA